MKKLFFAAALVAFIFSSCAKEDPAQGVKIDEAFKSRATVEGTVYLKVNKTGTDFQQYAPAGTKLSFTIANSAYGLTSTGNYIATATVGENGRYTISLPTREDGNAVSVKIDGDPFHFDVENGTILEDQLFTLTQQSQSIIKGFTYQKNFDYTLEDVLNETEAWVDGTYKIKLSYNSDLTNLTSTTFVPANTEIKVTVSKNQFVPERQNDLEFITKVGADGVLTVKLPAPTVKMNANGLSISLEAAEVFNIKTGVSGGSDVYNKFIFTYYKNAVVYGGVEVDGGKGTFSRGTQLTQN